jgi:selenoprotein W-related protein
LAARLKDEFDVMAEMIESSGGVFEVVVDGELIYSKKSTGEFPDDDMLVDKIRS